MITQHGHAYCEALANYNIAAVGQHIYDDIVVLSPIFATPSAGKDSFLAILAGLLGTINSIAVTLMFASGRDIAVFFTTLREGIAVYRNEHVHLDEYSLIDRIEIAWRPLPSVVLIQAELANKLRGEPMLLIPTSSIA
jgi:hypothetical protein